MVPDVFIWLTLGCVDSGSCSCPFPLVSLFSLDFSRNFFLDRHGLQPLTCNPWLYGVSDVEVTFWRGQFYNRMIKLPFFVDCDLQKNLSLLSPYVRPDRQRG